MSQPLSDFRGQSAAAAPQPAAVEFPMDFQDPTEPPESSDAFEAADPSAQAFSRLKTEIATLLQQGKRGAGWFYSIAGFSLINSLIMLLGKGPKFVVGLGATLLVDWGALQHAQRVPENAIAIKSTAFAFDLFVAAIVCGFGWLAVKRWQPVFVIGMLLYLLDGLLFLRFGRMMAVAFHAYCLYCMWKGFQAYQKLAVLERQLIDPLHPVGAINPHS